MSASGDLSAASLCR